MSSGSRHGSRTRASNPNSALSRALCSLLRHHAAEKGLTVNSAGYVPVQQVLETRELEKLQVSELEIQAVVQNCRKQRFSLHMEDGHSLIRCNQGHSGATAACIQNSSLLQLISATDAQDKYPDVVHGTYQRHVSSIQQHGLLRGKRQHVHLTTASSTSRHALSGFRSSCEVLMHIAMAQAIADGIQFWVSSNGVILTEGDGHGAIPPKYITRIEHR